MSGDTTQELRREVEFKDIKQLGFKRRCAYYAMAAMSGIILKAILVYPDLGSNASQMLESALWVCGFIIAGAMGVEGWQTYTNARAGK